MGMIKLRLTRTQIVEFEDGPLDGQPPEQLLAENLRNAEEMPEHVFDDPIETTITGEVVATSAPQPVAGRCRLCGRTRWAADTPKGHKCDFSVPAAAEDTCRRVWVCKRCGNCLDHCKHRDEPNFHEDLAMPCSIKVSYVYARDHWHDPGKPCSVCGDGG